jgi:hypothetical protein
MVNVYCQKCYTTTDHEVVESTSNTDRMRRKCTRCGWVMSHMVRHLAYQMRSTWCGLEIDGQQRALTTEIRNCDCHECALMLIEERGVADSPDWRPERAIAEDFYAH